MFAKQGDGRFVTVPLCIPRPVVKNTGTLQCVCLNACTHIIQKKESVK